MCMYNPFFDSDTGLLYHLPFTDAPPSGRGASVNGNIIKRPHVRIRKGISACRTKNHISPGEPHFALIIFNVLMQIFVIS